MPKILLVSPQPKETAQELRECGVDDTDAIKRHFQAVFRDLHVVSVSAEDTLPELGSSSKIDGIVISGSKLSVYREDIPWLAPLQDFVRTAVQEKIPMLGICFGHQIITQSLGGKVVLGSEGSEFGIMLGCQTDEGTRDPLFDGVEREFATSSFHSDVVVELPQLAERKATVLAHSAQYTNQALAIGDLIRTVQFHPELSIAMLDSLIKKRGVSENRGADDSTARERVEINGSKILANFILHFVIPNQK